jgi:hypothetical protein
VSSCSLTVQREKIEEDEHVVRPVKHGDVCYRPSLGLATFSSLSRFSVVSLSYMVSYRETNITHCGCLKARGLAQPQPTADEPRSLAQAADGMFGCSPELPVPCLNLHLA